MPSHPRGFFAHGSQLLVDSIPVGGLLDIPLPEEEREEVEITDMSSNFNREFVPGLRDNGELDLVMRLIPGDPGQEHLRHNAGDPDAIMDCAIILPQHVSPRLSWEFDAWVRSTGGTLFWEGTAAERTVTLRVTSGVEESEA
jgi:hypothetical protein